MLAQSKSIAELFPEGPYADWEQFDIKAFNSRLDYIKAVVNATNATKDIGNMITC